MIASKVALLDFIGKRDQVFIIPVYQRNYAWKRSDVETLLTDIFTIIDDNYSYEYNLGMMVFYDDVDEAGIFSKRILVDGQQRTLTIMLLIRALIAKLNEAGNTELAQDYYDKYISSGNSRFEKYRLKLKPGAQDDDSFAKIMEMENETRKATVARAFREFNISNSPVAKNYNTILSVLNGRKEYAPEEIMKALRKLTVINMQLQDTTSHGEDPQVVFNNVNSKGEQLSEADIIRNLLLMGLKYDQQVDAYNNQWQPMENTVGQNNLSKFFNVYLQVKKGAFIQQRDTIKVANDRFSHLSAIDKIRELGDVDEMKDYYAWIKDGERAPTDDPREILGKFNALGYVTFDPFFCYLFFAGVDYSEIVEIMNDALNYLLRQRVCDISANAIAAENVAIIAKLRKKLDRGEKINAAEWFKSELISRDNQKRYPDDDEFIQKLVVNDFYGSQQEKVIFREFFARIEKSNNKGGADFSNYTIEHIMPQTLSEKTTEWNTELGIKYDENGMMSEDAAREFNKYVNKLGNLTLMAYNSENSNKPFYEKRTRYANENLSITRDVANKKAWNYKEIGDRSWRLAEQIAKVCRINGGAARPFAEAAAEVCEDDAETGKAQARDDAESERFADDQEVRNFLHEVMVKLDRITGAKLTAEIGENWFAGYEEEQKNQHGSSSWVVRQNDMKEQLNILVKYRDLFRNSRLHNRQYREFNAPIEGLREIRNRNAHDDKIREYELERARGDAETLLKYLEG